MVPESSRFQAGLPKSALERCGVGFVIGELRREVRPVEEHEHIAHIEHDVLDLLAIRCHGCLRPTFFTAQYSRTQMVYRYASIWKPSPTTSAEVCLSQATGSSSPLNTVSLAASSFVKSLTAYTA